MNEKVLTKAQQYLASLHDTSEATPRDWKDNLHHPEGWTPLTCPSCKLSFRGWKLKKKCVQCAIPVWPLQTVRHICGVAISHQEKIWTLPAPNRHSDVIVLIINELGRGVSSRSTQGFYDNHGVFLNRVDALAVAISANQLICRIEDIRSGQLFSEDLW
jgi:hypothetical protein